MNVIGQQDMPTKLLGKRILDIDNVIPPIELAGNKKGWRGEHDLPLNRAFGVAQTDILLPLVRNRKCIDVTECWKCHGGQGYPKRLGASTRHYCPQPFSFALKRRCLGWSQDSLAQLWECAPDVPETLNDRAADNWRPLCAIAEVASGEWPQRVLEAIKALATEESDSEAAGIILLQDIKDIFDQHGAEEEESKAKVLSSKQIVQYLYAIEERPWSEWSKTRKPITERQLADVLRPFEIRSRTVPSLVFGRCRRHTATT